MLLGKNLEFTDLDLLTIKFNNWMDSTNIWFCKARYWTIYGHSKGFNFYKSQTYDPFSPRNYSLEYGDHVEWTLNGCAIFGHFNSCNLIKWNVINSEFAPILNNCQFIDCTFIREIDSSWDIDKAYKLFKYLRIAYSVQGRMSEAAHNYYLEKRYERKRFLHPLQYQREIFPKRLWVSYTNIEIFKALFKTENKYFVTQFLKSHFIMLKSEYFLEYLRCYCRYIVSLFNNVIWGYGERPIRVVMIAVSIIIFFAAYFYFNTCSVTSYSMVNSIYYSTVTFTTLGYGDIYQKTSDLKLASGIEALLGIIFMGLVVAGFSNKNKY